VQRVTLRDVAILRDVGQYRYLTSAQVLRLHFGSRKVAQRRLRALTTVGLLHRFSPAEAHRAGFRTWWYALSRAGARHLSTLEGFPLAAVLPPTRPPSTLGFLAHHALTTDFRIWLHEVCKQGAAGREVAQRAHGARPCAASTSPGRGWCLRGNTS